MGFCFLQRLAALACADALQGQAVLVTAAGSLLGDVDMMWCVTANFPCRHRGGIVVQVSWIWGWFAELAALGLFLLYRIGLSKARELRCALHEEKYLVGRQLLNLTRIPSAGVPMFHQAQETSVAEHTGGSSLQAGAAI